MRGERGTSCTRFHCLQRVSLLRISPSILSFSSSLLLVSNFLSFFSLSLFAPESRFFPLRTFIPATSQRRCGSFFRVGTIFVKSLRMQLWDLRSRIRKRFSLSFIYGVRKLRKKERKKRRVPIDRITERRQARCGAEWEEARLLEEGRNWGDDPPAERNPETPRARDLSCEDAALFVHDVPNVSLLLSFCAPLSSCPRPCNTRSPLFPAPPMRPLALLFRSPSFTLPRCSRRRYGRFDAEERRYQDDDLR